MDAQIFVNGMQWGKVEAMVPRLNYEDFANELMAALGMSKEDFVPESEFAARAMVAKSMFSFALAHAPDPWNPAEVGWALVLPPRGTETEAIAAALDPLVRHRNGRVIYSPVEFDSCPADEWIRNNYSVMASSDRPYYVLLAGPVEKIPFRLQFNFDVTAAVGRLSLDAIEDYAAYAGKVVEFETRDELYVSRHAVVFATEHEVTRDEGATFLSRHLMAQPLMDLIKDKNIPLTALLGDDTENGATFDNLQKAALTKTDGVFPALVYTATHGLCVPNNERDPKDEDNRRRMQGAIVCQDYDGRKGVFSVENLPVEPVLHGSIVFAFACYGAGTPRRSDFFHWLHDPRLQNCQPTADFAAALPVKMLAHPRGPLAFMGHIGPSFGLTIADLGKTGEGRKCGPGAAPFRDAVDWLLQGAPIGYAANPINMTYAQLSVSLADNENDYRADPQKVQQNAGWKAALVNKWVARNDMQNFIVLGDPAARAKMK